LCKSLSRVTFASGSCLKRIEERAFSECTRLQEIEIPASVEVLCEECFGPARDGLGKMIASCESLSRVTFAPGSCLKRIERWAFYSCNSLKEMEIPASVQEIGGGCFRWSSLSRVTFASGSVLKRIGKQAFSGCSQLREIEIPATVEVGDGIGLRVIRV
jgi:hypothetical protein